MGIKRCELNEAQWERISALLPGKPCDPGRTGSEIVRTIKDRNPSSSQSAHQSGPTASIFYAGSQPLRSNSTTLFRPDCFA